jgi:hypothetical protein
LLCLLLRALSASAVGVVVFLSVLRASVVKSLRSFIGYYPGVGAVREGKKVLALVGALRYSIRRQVYT